MALFTDTKEINKSPMPHYKMSNVCEDWEDCSPAAGWNVKRTRVIRTQKPKVKLVYNIHTKKIETCQLNPLLEITLTYVKS
jgi:hypothetical protein